MTDEEYKDLVIGRLTEIRDLLVVLAIVEPPPVEGPVICHHPEEQRIDLSTMGRTGFACKACKHQELFDRRTREPLGPFVF